MISHVKLSAHTKEEYYKTPEGARLELVDGAFHDMAAPSRYHQKILVWLLQRIGRHIEEKGLACEIYCAPFDVELFEAEDTVVQPDISVICDPSKLTEHGCTGAPDFIVEIASPSDVRHDYLTKANLYARAGVREYWIVDPMRQMTVVYSFSGDGESDEVKVYPFTGDAVPVGICEDFAVDFKEIAENEE